MSPTVEIQLSGTISEGTDPRRWLTLAVVVLAGFIALLDATVDGLIIDGRLGDIFRRKRKFLFGVAGFRVRGRANWRATLRTPDNV